MFFTVFTPVYNRKHTIHRVWESLLRQTNQNFEWLIVNDGSEDKITELLESYKNKADFSVRIFNQENSGKHIAFNLAIDEARGELLIPADSDDSFIPSTIERFSQIWNEYGGDSISGIDVLCMNEEGQIIGDIFPKEGISNYKEVFFKHRVKGEKWGCIRVDILKKYKFPKMFGAKFFPESFIWAQIGLNYDTIYMNEPLRKYYQDAGNQLIKDEKITFGDSEIKNFNSIWWVNNIYPSVKKHLSVKEILKRFFAIWKTTFDINKSYVSAIKELTLYQNKILAILTFIPAYFLVKIVKL